eukprot:356652-Chlamydomonas_euryale.AAC.4
MRHRKAKELFMMFRATDPGGGGSSDQAISNCSNFSSLTCAPAAHNASHPQTRQCHLTGRQSFKFNAIVAGTKYFWIDRCDATSATMAGQAVLGKRCQTHKEFSEGMLGRACHKASVRWHDTRMSARMLPPLPSALCLVLFEEGSGRGLGGGLEGVWQTSIPEHLISLTGTVRGWGFPSAIQQLVVEAAAASAASAAAAGPQLSLRRAPPDCAARTRALPRTCAELRACRRTCATHLRDALARRCRTLERPRPPRAHLRDAQPPQLHERITAAQLCIQARAR